MSPNSKAGHERHKAVWGFPGNEGFHFHRPPLQSPVLHYTGPTGKVRVPVSDVDVLEVAFQFFSAADTAVQGLAPGFGGELSVGDNVGVAPDGAREVRVNLARKAVVLKLGIPLRAGRELVGGEYAAGAGCRSEC